MMRCFPYARQVLAQVEEGRSQVARLRREVQELESRCTACTGRFDRLGGSGDVHGREGLWAQLADRRKRLYDRQNQLDALERRTERWIDQLPRPRWRMVLRYHYLEGLELPDVAQELTEATGRSFSTSQIYRLHREALQCAEGLWPRNTTSVSAPPADVPTVCGTCPSTPAATAPPKAAIAAGQDLNEGEGPV